MIPPHENNIVLTFLAMTLIVLALMTSTVSNTAAAVFQLMPNQIRVLDGDTIEVVLDSKTYRIRLKNIDAPEKHQAFGPEATEFLRKEVDAQVIYLVTSLTPGNKTYNRFLGTLYTQDGENVNIKLVAEGLAWWYRKYADDDTYLHWEDAARRKNKGLWKQEYPVAPWLYRKGITKEINSPYYDFKRLGEQY